MKVMTYSWILRMDYDDYEDYEDDDVSEMGEDEGFDEDDDGVSEAEQTRNEEDRYGADE
jgi:hypothetical protein